MRYCVVFTLVIALLWAGNSRAADELLQYDSFVSGDPVSIQAGFVVGESAAVRFAPTIACPCFVESLTVVFGGNTNTVTVGIQIWDDPGGTQPGTLLYSGEVVLTGSTENLQQIDLTATPILVTRPFRVGLVFQHDGLPGIATDLDGTVDAGANFILADVGGTGLWFPAALLGVSGDFILRARVRDITAPDTDLDGVGDAIDNCTNLQNADQRDDDTDGYGNRCDADFNNDCAVNFADLGALRSAFFSSEEDANWNPTIDLNLDGTINSIDLGLLRTLFFQPPGPSALTDLCQ